MILDAQTVVFPVIAALAGYGAGRLHFASLHRIADLIVAGRLAAIGLQLGRLVLLGVFLFLCVQFGAATLLAGAAGILTARQRVVGREP